MGAMFLPPRIRNTSIAPMGRSYTSFGIHHDVSHRIRPPAATRQARRTPRRHRPGHRRPTGRGGAVADRPVGRRPLPARRRARPGQDAAGALAGRSTASAVPPRAVHAGPDAQRHPRHRAAGGRPRHGPSPFPFPARPDLHQSAAGRRTQPHAAEDPGRAAGGDAGTHRQLRRHHPCAAVAVLRAGHAEPAGAGRHLSAAGSAAGPLPAAYPRGLPDRTGRARHPGADHRPRRWHGTAGNGRRRGAGTAEACARRACQ